MRRSAASSRRAPPRSRSKAAAPQRGCSRRSAPSSTACRARGRRMPAPECWFRPPGAAAALLSPLGLLYAAGGRLREAFTLPWKAPVPVICCGNLTVGGSGKTPTALAIARAIAARDLDPVFLTRGYGGRLSGPVIVDSARHSAADVGDEPLLLAARAPTLVAPDRKARARP